MWVYECDGESSGGSDPAAIFLSAKRGFNTGEFSTAGAALDWQDNLEVLKHTQAHIRALKTGKATLISISCFPTSMMYFFLYQLTSFSFANNFLTTLSMEKAFTYMFWNQ